MEGTMTIGEWVEAHPDEAAKLATPPKAEPVDAPWYIVHSVHRSDRKAIEWLNDRGIETYYPLLREIRAVPKKELSKKQRASGIVIMRPRLVPCLPRYIFVRCDMGRAGVWDIFDFAGVGGMVCAGGLPVAISEGEIACMRNSEEDGAIPGPSTIRVVFKVGDRVRVKDGPFASFPGEVERGLDIPLQELDADTRIRVAVHIFGQATPVDLEVSQVEKQ